MLGARPFSGPQNKLVCVVLSSSWPQGPCQALGTTQAVSPSSMCSQARGMDHKQQVCWEALWDTHQSEQWGHRRANRSGEGRRAINFQNEQGLMLGSP